MCVLTVCLCRVRWQGALNSFSWRQIYRRLLGIETESQLYSTSMGFLIRDDLHRAYERYEWSWYYKVSALHQSSTAKAETMFFQDGLFYPHFFALEGSDLAQLHGIQIDPRITMRVQPREYLDPVLTSMHYQQTVLMRIRGSAEGFGGSFCLCWTC